MRPWHALAPDDALQQHAPLTLSVKQNACNGGPVRMTPVALSPRIDVRWLAMTDYARTR